MASDELFQVTHNSSKCNFTLHERTVLRRKIWKEIELDFPLLKVYEQQLNAVRPIMRMECSVSEALTLKGKNR